MANTIYSKCKSVAFASMLIVVVLTVTSSASANYTLDRWYRMGDDAAEPANPGDTVGTGAGFLLTFDSAGSSGSSNFQDLTPVGDPVYVDISSDQPFPNSTLDNRAIQLDGTTQYLHGQNLNKPEDADIATGQVEDYTGISDRGYQLWFKPNSVIAETFSFVLDDANTHATLIDSAGNLGFETRTDIRSSTLSANDSIGNWVHMTQVRPDGDAGGSLGWINGRAVVSQTGGYDTTHVELAIGADAEDDTLGGTIFTPSFDGLVSDVEMFVLGGSFGTFDYTEDNGYFTDVYLPTTAGYGYADSNSDGHNDNAWIKGDINFDGSLDSADVAAFISGWLTMNNGEINGSGPSIGDYVTLGFGDLDTDGDTDVDDWIALRATGVSASTSAAALESLGLGATVPEPSSLLLAALASAGLSVRFGRSKRS